MTKALPLTIAKYLVEYGYPKEKVAKYTGDTRLFHDIGLYGDNAFDDLLAVQKQFQIDFSAFFFHRYFPGNFGWKPLVLTCCWNSAWANKIKGKYASLTLDMLEEAIHRKKWTFG